MKFNPKDADQKLIPDGDYDAVIVNAEETKSQAGNDMLKLTVRVYAKGEESLVFDRIVFPSFTWKLKTIAQALGMMPAFESGSLETRELIERNIKVSVKTRKDETGKYGDQNVIARYLRDASAPPKQVRDAGQDDDLTF